jgi:phosphohistidine phosphatase
MATSIVSRLLISVRNGFSEDDGYMKLYLVQHGDALAKDIDPDRPLSEKGQSDVKHIASFISEHMEVPRVLHSGKTRARQTAELLADSIASGLSVEAISGISPNDPVEDFAQQLIGRNEDVLVVGHLPFMAKLVAWLVTTGTDEQAIVSYQPGSIVCIESAEDGRWLIQWIIRPELLSD